MTDPMEIIGSPMPPRAFVTPIEFLSMAVAWFSGIPPGITFT